MKGITKAQRIYLMGTLWPDACQFQGWQVKDEARRYQVYAETLGYWADHAKTLEKGRPIRTADFVKGADRDDFGEIKRALLDLAGLKAKQRDDPARQTLLWVIAHRLMPCYALYRPGKALETILQERFKRISGWNTVADLEPADLKKLIYTLEARVHAAMSEAGETHHKMCRRAGVERWKPCPAGCVECLSEKCPVETNQPF